MDTNHCSKFLVAAIISAAAACSACGQQRDLPSNIPSPQVPSKDVPPSNGMPQVPARPDGPTPSASTATPSTSSSTLSKPDANSQASSSASAETAIPGALSSPDVPVPTWAEVKGTTYAQRSQLFAALNKMQAKVDAQIKELTDKRGNMTGKDDVDWDKILKDLRDSRSYLKSTADDLSKANSETWDQRRDRVGQALDDSQKAYEKAKSTIGG